MTDIAARTSEVVAPGLGAAGPIAVDNDGNAYAVGLTGSANFPVTSDAYDDSLGGTDAFIVKVNAGGSAIDYATYLGGDTALECANGCGMALDSGGNVFIVGDTTANDYPTSDNPYDTSYNGDPQDAFFARLPTESAGSEIFLPIVIK